MTDGLIQEAQLREWEALKGKGMESAVGEYTPGEFWQLIDSYRNLAYRYFKLVTWAESKLSTDNRMDNFMCPPGRVQIGLPEFEPMSKELRSIVNPDWLPPTDKRKP